MNLPAIIVDDWPRKLTALCFALLIWFSVHTQLQERDTIRGITVRLKHSKGIAVLDRENIPKVDITVRGSKKRIHALTPADITATVKVGNDVTGGQFLVQLREPNIELPARIEIENIQPDSFAVSVDRVKTVSKRVLLRTEGDLASDLQVKTFTIIPETVLVTGPQRIVTGLPDIVTEPLFLDPNRRTGFDIEVPLITGPRISVSPERVRVIFELSRSHSEKSFTELAVEILNSVDSDYFVSFKNSPDPRIAVVISGPTATVDVLTESSINCYVRVSDVTAPGEYRKRVQVTVDARECQVNRLTPPLLVLDVKPRTKTPPH